MDVLHSVNAEECNPPGVDVFNLANNRFLEFGLYEREVGMLIGKEEILGEAKQRLETALQFNDLQELKDALATGLSAVETLREQVVNDINVLLGRAEVEISENEEKLNIIFDRFNACL